MDLSMHWVHCSIIHHESTPQELEKCFQWAKTECRDSRREPPRVTQRRWVTRSVVWHLCGMSSACL